MALLLPLRIVADALRPLTVRIRRRWRLYAARRRRDLTIARLETLSDRSLKDIGVVRSEIHWVTRHGRYEPRRLRAAALKR